MHLAVSGTFWQQPHVGSGQYVRQLVAHLDRLVSDLRITLVVPVQADSEPVGAPPDVTVHPVTTRPGHLGKVWFEQVGFGRVCATVSADVALVPYWGSPLRSPVPVVVTIHDLIPLRFRAYRRRPLARLYTALVSASARGADHILTDSDASRRDIVEHLGVEEARVTAVPLAAGTMYAPAMSERLVDMAIREKYELPEQYVLYLGGYDAHKNVLTLLEAYTYVARALGKDVPLLLAGKRPLAAPPQVPDYDTAVGRLGLQDYVRWLGFVDEADKPVVYREASTFVFPSRYEGFGLPVLEALACGVPVVTTTASSLPEVIGNAGFAVDPDSARDMAGAIIATVVQEDLAADLRRQGPEQAARFSWEATATQTLSVLADVLDAASKR